ncbi:hypothetical protein COU74_03330 [Candidatus Peregrinibacteria bacterium CG10_big_fil_rev_8_21_14_0_10_36_19]|nr:MAG: hypothetical protein COU74_03330 [Candidatus Peregrinibacteria bacterium CG10_big_fil_rev_8_21_14_0_10_36_19]
MYTGNATNVAQTVAELSELVNNLLLLLSDKEKVVVKKRFDLDGSGKMTLEQIGQEFAVTRERVRQIEKNALSKMKRNVFNTSLKHLHEFTNEVVSQHGGLVKEDDLIDDLKKSLPSGMTVNESGIHLSLVLNDEVECIGNTINFYPYVRNKKISDYSLKYASSKIVNQLHKYGNIKSVDRVHGDIKPILKDVDIDLCLMKSLISIDKRMAILDNEMVGLLEWRHVNPRTLRDKILYILRNSKKPMHFSDIASKIENSEFDKRQVNIQAVHNELIRHDQFILIGRGIYALEEWGYESGTVSAVIEKLLSGGKELSQEEIVEGVLSKRQVKKITIVLALKNGTQFERVGRKRYKLKA